MRKPVDEYFMDIAKEVSKRATCPRASVGCVLVRNKQMLATGYNGAPKGLPHCMDVGCIIESQHCRRSVHSEINAIIQAAYHGTSVRGGKIYCTTRPCSICTKMIINAGIEEVIYIEEYDDELAAQLVKESDLLLRKIEIPRKYGRNSTISE